MSAYLVRREHIDYTVCEGCLDEFEGCEVEEAEGDFCDECGGWTE